MHGLAVCRAVPLPATSRQHCQVEIYFIQLNCTASICRPVLHSHPSWSPCGPAQPRFISQALYSTEFAPQSWMSAFFPGALGRTPLCDATTSSSSLPANEVGTGGARVHHGKGDCNNCAAQRGGPSAVAAAAPPPIAFPASRAHLWDRSQNGPVAVVDMKVSKHSGGVSSAAQCL
jgi:hypothetical protein